MPIQYGCLFCTDEPCATHADKPRKTRVKKQINQPVAQVTSKSKFNRRAEQAQVIDRELREAIVNLIPLLHEEELKKHKDLINLPKNSGLITKRSEVRRYLNEDD